MSASVEPTILYCISSPEERSLMRTVEPMLIALASTSLLLTTSAFFKIFSISSIRISISLCSSFAASYSAFSDKSPCSLASLIFAATSLRLFTFKSCNSSSSFARPSSVKMFFFSAMISSFLRAYFLRNQIVTGAGHIYHLRFARCAQMEFICQHTLSCNYNTILRVLTMMFLRYRKQIFE